MFVSPFAMRAWTALGVVIACSLPIPAALGGPPLVTDDPETPGRGDWEINISHNIVKTRDEFAMATPLIDINYGLLENDQWKLEFPVLFLDPENGQGRWGIGDIEVGWKYRFFDERDRGFMASVYPQVLIPTATRHALLNDERLILGSGRAEMFLPLEVGRHFCDEKLFVYGEIGYNVVFDGSNEHSWIYGVAAEWQKSERLKLLFEVGGIAWQSGSDPDFSFFNGGLKYELSEHWTLIGSAGRSFRYAPSNIPVLMTFLGLQWTTGDDPHR